MNQFSPEVPPSDSLNALANFIYREHQRMAAIINLGYIGFIEFQSKPPDKPKEGQVLGADGVNWNPGADGQKGIFYYVGGSWHKLG